jgi:hypothetical protein
VHTKALVERHDSVQHWLLKTGSSGVPQAAVGHLLAHHRLLLNRYIQVKQKDRHLRGQYRLLYMYCKKDTQICPGTAKTALEE